MVRVVVNETLPADTDCTFAFFEFVKLRIRHGMCLSGAQPRPRFVLGANPNTGYTSII